MDIYDIYYGITRPIISIFSYIGLNTGLFGFYTAIHPAKHYLCNGVLCVNCKIGRYLI